MTSKKVSITPAACAVGLAVVALAVIGFAAYERTAGQLMEGASDKYMALMQIRRDALREHLEDVGSEVRYWAGDRAMREVLADFTVAWRHMGHGASQRLRRAYVTDNPYPIGERYKLSVARDGSDYSTLHGAHHGWMRRFLEQHGYYDVFLFTPGGDLIYTAFKEDDFGTNLVGGTYRESGLGQAFRAARAAAEPGTIAFADFAPYAPSHGAPAAFVASPVLGEDGDLLGVLAFQLAIAPIDAIMQATAGMGESGETYVVGPDLLMRSDSRFAEHSTILKTRVDTETVHKALAGETGVELAEDYLGKPVLSAYGPLEFRAGTWAVVAEVNEAEVLDPIRRLRNFLVVSCVLAMLVVSAIVGFALSLLLNRPAQPGLRHTSVG